VKRGDVITVSAPGDYGKPRPAVVIQSDSLNTNDSILVAPFTSTLRDAPIYRLTVEPSAPNGLKLPSQIMVDKITAIARSKCGKVVGRLDDGVMLALNHVISAVCGIAD